MPNVWIHMVMAATIALIAFFIGQIAPGAGMAVVALGSTSWTAYAAKRQQLRP